MSGLPVRACTRARLQSSLPFAARQSLQRRYASSESDSLEEAVNVKSVLDIGRDLSMKVPKTKPLVRIRGLGFWRDKPTKPAEENDTTSTLELPKEKRIEDSFVVSNTLTLLLLCKLNQIHGRASTCLSKVIKVSTRSSQ